MRRYFFNIKDGRDIPDKEGTLLADNNAARQEAIATGGTILRDLSRYWDGTEWTMNVVDETGKSVFTLLFSAEINPA